MAYAQLIDNYLFMKDCEIEADFTVVLGMTLWRRPLMRALEL